MEWSCANLFRKKRQHYYVEGKNAHVYLRRSGAVIWAIEGEHGNAKTIDEAKAIVTAKLVARRMTS